MNEKSLPTLLEAQVYNETAAHRNVGLVIETRPDHVDEKEIDRLRYLGVTKVQLGAQSFDEHILAINKRGHTAAETLAAVDLLRAAGFKIVLHWMPNLLGATPESDRADFIKLWQGYCPDEIKIFPRYSRVNRVIRDIPSTNVVAGNKRTSLRMDVHERLRERGERCECVRCREVREKSVAADNLNFDDLCYETTFAEEHFLSFNTPKDGLAGFLRLSLPGADSPNTGQTDLDGAAIIREVHVYGQSVEVGEEKAGAAQHIGLGTQLIAEAEAVARAKGFTRMAVIAAVGTRDYYRGRGFALGRRYMVKDLF
jgi:elongator complex protein 3